MYVLWAVDETSRPFLRIATSERLRGFFGYPEADYEDDGMPKDPMSFMLVEAKLDVPWNDPGPDGCYGLRVSVHDAHDRTLGHYNVAPTSVELLKVGGVSTSIEISGYVSPHPQVGGDVVWQRWCDNLPARVNEWAALDLPGRQAWLHVVALHAFEQGQFTDKEGPFVLDGSAVTDEVSFYCAIGEAINGPGGYFGWNVDAFYDCLIGKWGAKPGFTLVWKDSAIGINVLPAEFVGDMMTGLEQSGADIVLS